MSRALGSPAPGDEKARRDLGGCRQASRALTCLPCRSSARHARPSVICRAASRHSRPCDGHLHPAPCRPVLQAASVVPHRGRRQGPALSRDGCATVDGSRARNAAAAYATHNDVRERSPWLGLRPRRLAGSRSRSSPLTAAGGGLAVLRCVLHPTRTGHSSAERQSGEPVINHLLETTSSLAPIGSYGE